MTTPTGWQADEEFGLKGYKTLGISIAEGDGEWVFIGILPMIDPPRHDSKETIRKIKAAGVRIKVITGDHVNIAKETARLIGLGQNILPHTELEIPSAVRDATIEAADGFAQVRRWRLAGSIRTSRPFLHDVHSPGEAPW